MTLLTPSKLPFGLPDWQAVNDAELLPELETALATQREAWAAIASSTEPPTAENVLHALEAADAAVDRVSTVIYTLGSSIGGDRYDELEAKASEKIVAQYSAFHQDRAIFARLRALEDSGALEGDVESQELLRDLLADFRQGGIDADAPTQARIREIDDELSKAEVEFEQRVVKAMDAYAPEFEAEAELAGLDPDAVTSAKTESGTFRLELENVTNQPVLAQLTDPKTRAKVLQASISRGLATHPETDTRDLVVKIARLRAERAKLLGFPHHSQAVAEREMAKSSQAIIDLLAKLARPAVAAARTHETELAELAQRDGVAPLTASDWLFYQERQRAQLGLDDEAMKPYFLLENVVERGIFFAAHELYGITFEPRPNLRGYLPSVRTWEVKDASGTPIALFQGDFYRRKGKKGGAWMNEVGYGDERTGALPTVMNNCNFAEPEPGKPTLLTWDSVITVFHEFGHALHAILSKTNYRSSSGTNVPRDFVEAPSQLNEMWAYNPKVLANFAVHYETGEALPSEIVSALVAAKTFGQPFETTELVAAALLDQAWHRRAAEDLPTNGEELETFEADALKEYGVDYALIPPRYRSAYFSHTFGGGYDAGYYSYIWAEVIAADLELWFTGEMDRGGDGGLNREAGEVLARELLSRGSSRDPMESVRSVLGRDPNPEAILVRRGLI